MFDCNEDDNTGRKKNKPEEIVFDWTEKDEPKEEYYFSKLHPDDTIWDVSYRIPREGPILFSFDKIKIYNFWTDYPNNLTPEEKEIFDKEWTYWANFYNGVDNDDSVSASDVELYKEETSKDK